MSGVTQLESAVWTIQQLTGERDRARALAARLEEVVAARTAVLEALVEWAPENAHKREVSSTTLFGIVAWAKGQLEEVP